MISRILNHGIGTGHQPLSWCARVQIALDGAKGLEYIHDYTKARYVHRDIKTSNILLDEKLRAKVLILELFYSLLLWPKKMSLLRKNYGPVMDILI